MRDTGSRSTRVSERSLSFWSAMLALLLLGTGCGSKATDADQPINIQLYQKWALEPGDTIAGHTVTGGLGDISIALNGEQVYAPFDGRTQLDKRGCLIFSSTEVPAYLFRLCGIKQSNLGGVRRGDPIGKGDTLEFATLRKQPNGTWAIVEPSKQMLERTLKRL